jgi:hypothetical protein
LIDPIQKLRQSVYLVVMRGMRELQHLIVEGPEPWRAPGKMDSAFFDFR